ncbi:MAG TPA: oxygen-independent coproporphyrinogen III oxidase, partial [Dongiaceae bacterium]|nr:oxygen-independent coproporphyrinogen III oxidase [Dongiaceae bacterium]
MYLVKGGATRSFQWDSEFIRQHDVPGPRYTSYPTALQFHEEFTQQDYRAAVARSNASRKPLSIYVHLPFCQSLCYYCACNKVITQNEDRKRQYLDHLIDEIKQKAADFGTDRPVYQMHWGGGTPTYYGAAELTELWYQIGRHFHLVESERGDYSIEIDPRTIDGDKLGLLKGLGFNRISLGIQDFDPRVQQAINRVQSTAQVAELMEAARSYQFRSVNFDLIYGLPYQSVTSVQATLDQVIELAPDRISLFNYAHLPERFKSQGLLPEEALPAAE